MVMSLRWRRVASVWARVLPGGRLMLSWLKPVSARGMKPVGRSGRSCQEAAKMRAAALRVVLRWRSVHSRAC